PLVFEYAFTNRTELTVEPVFGTSIRPKHSPSASGAGDVELTLTHLFVPEAGAVPAFAGALEVKLPTAKNRLIGTGKTDFTAWAIASKRLGNLDLHANLGYTVVGKPAGTNLSNIVDYAIAEEYHLSPRVDVVGEVLGNTSSLGENGNEGGGATGIPAEAAGAEKSLMVGMRYKWSPALAFSIGVSYDNNHALLIRPGITWRFGR
ncbi:MAG TPA: transporter, partial [Thermoanaerobaculia bacterium]|nr:transporter [Thermoanaerobaculia bacterium]